MQRKRNLHRSKSGGFTLTELSIVLGMTVLIIGAIWVAFSGVANGNRVSRTVQQVVQVSQNIREYYMNAQGIPVSACATDITGDLDRNSSNTYTDIGIFPAEMRSRCTTCASPYTYKIDSAFVSATGPAGGIGNGSFRVKGAGACFGAPQLYAPRFWVVLTNLTPAACVDLLFSGVAYQDQSLGVTSICSASESGGATPCYTGTAYNGTQGWAPLTCANGLCGICPLGSSCPPYSAITLAQAQKFCTNNAANYKGTSEVGWEFTMRD